MLRGSIAAVGVATHEAGYAIQCARHYAPLWLRSALVPTASIGSSLGYGAMAIGLFLASTNLVLLGAVEAVPVQPTVAFRRKHHD